MINVVINIKLNGSLLKNIINIHRSEVPSDSLENLIPLRIKQLLNRNGILHEDFSTEVIRKQGMFANSYMLIMTIKDIKYTISNLDLYGKILNVLKPYFDRIEDFKLKESK